MLQHKSRIFDCKISHIGSDRWNEAMDLAWRTFLVYEGADYTSEGVDNFYSFITDDKLKQLSCLGLYDVYGAYTDGKIVGIISLRNGNHISLLFVDGDLHRNGIGRALVDYLSDLLRKDGRYDRITVDAAPYGVEFYHRLGFIDTSIEQSRDGIIFTPMERLLNE